MSLPRVRVAFHGTFAAPAPASALRAEREARAVEGGRVLLELASTDFRAVCCRSRVRELRAVLRVAERRRPSAEIGLTAVELGELFGPLDAGFECIHGFFERTQALAHRRLGIDRAQGGASRRLLRFRLIGTGAREQAFVSAFQCAQLESARFLPIAARRALVLLELRGALGFTLREGSCVAGSEPQKCEGCGQRCAEDELSPPAAGLPARLELGELMRAPGIVGCESCSRLGFDPLHFGGGSLARFGLHSSDGLGRCPFAFLGLIGSGASVFFRSPSELRLASRALASGLLAGGSRALFFEATLFDAREIGQGQGDGGLGVRHGRLRILSETPYCSPRASDLAE